MRSLKLGLVAALTVSVVAISSGTGQASSCARAVTGGTEEQRAAVGRILCLMPGTFIESIQILDQLHDAPPDALWLVVTLPPELRAPGHFIEYYRAEWETFIAAAAVRDGFARLGFPHVIAFEKLFRADPIRTEILWPLALPEWNIPRWTMWSGALPPTLGHHVGTWPRLEAKLDKLSRRFQVATRLERYNPFGKAPVVTVLTNDIGAFITDALQPFKEALYFNEARFDGVLLEARDPAGNALQVTTIDRGPRRQSCTAIGSFPGSDEICHH